MLRPLNLGTIFLSPLLLPWSELTPTQVKFRTDKGLRLMFGILHSNLHSGPPQKDYFIDQKLSTATVEIIPNTKYSDEQREDWEVRLKFSGFNEN